ncbi:hypothetical protein [Aliamphritea ceti]|uniref:hypothetical protein n=1 Tax=Aliamphritea ceti TaxID=1524258 RepID=UPI0021C4482E|nr:hypothetical protein [Aliamphritea ceti]
MQSFIKLTTIAVAVLWLSACSSKVMMKSESPDVVAPPAEKATVVFMRKSIVASAVGVEIFEVVDDELSFVGALPTGDKIAHQTSPGTKVYMAYGAAADFMIANVIGGKTYYSIVRPNWGTGGFAPTPIRQTTSEYNMQTDDFKSWDSGTALIEKNPTADEWFQQNKAKYQAIYEKYWQRFQSKTPDEKQQRTLMPEDGI